MNIDEIVEGIPYVVEAPGCVKKTERWTLKDKKQTKDGWYVEMRGSFSPYVRTFTPDQVVSIDKKVEKKLAESIISESIELVTTIQGKEMWVERIDNWPLQKRRGRKRKSEVAA